MFGLSLPAFAQPAEAPPPPAKKAPKKDRGKKKPVVDLSAEVAALNGADLEVAAKAADTLGASAEPAAHDALLAHCDLAEVQRLRREAEKRGPLARGELLGRQRLRS